MGLRLTHIWLGFPDLKQAVKTYLGLGFRVCCHGGRAQIFLPDGVVLELVSLADPPVEAGGEFLRRRHRLYGRAGLLDYALAEEEGLEVALSRLKQANIPHHRVGHGLFPKRVVCNPPLPLLQGFLSPNPAPEQTQQPNGVTGLHALVVGSPAYPAALAQHRRLLGPPLAFEAYEGRRRAVFAIGKHFLYLQGAEQEGLQGLILRSRYALWGALEPTQTLGVALSLVGDPVFELTGDSAPETEG